MSVCCSSVFTSVQVVTRPSELTVEKFLFLSTSSACHLTCEKKSNRMK